MLLHLLPLLIEMIWSAYPIHPGLTIPMVERGVGVRKRDVDGGTRLPQAVFYVSLRIVKILRAGVLLLLAMVSAARAATYPSAAGIWTGQYDCAQGSTALELDICLLDPTYPGVIFLSRATRSYAGAQMPYACQSPASLNIN
jgi:hypothetical protein